VGVSSSDERRVGGATSLRDSRPFKTPTEKATQGSENPSKANGEKNGYRKYRAHIGGMVPKQ
jgi:hypothetical protein